MKKLSLLLLSSLLSLAIAIPALAQNEPVVYQDAHLSVEVDSSIASEVMATDYEATPYDETVDMPLWAANPSYWEYELLDYPNADQFFRPATIALYATSDFEPLTERGGDFPYGYGIELDLLNTLLADQSDLSSFVVADTNNETVLPYLPIANAAQVFRAQPIYLDFQNGSGIRYLTYYSQSVNPIEEGNIFYTFQGVSDDGSTYISVNFPLITGIFPTQTPADFNYDDFTANYMDFLTESLSALDNQAGSAFTPTLEQLDAIVQSILVNP